MVENDSPQLYNLSPSIFNSQSVFKSSFQNFSTKFFKNSIFCNLSLTIYLSKDFFHRLTLTCCLSQSFSTISLPQQFSLTSFSQSLQNVRRIVIRSLTSFSLIEPSHPHSTPTKPSPIHRLCIGNTLTLPILV